MRKSVGGTRPAGHACEFLKPPRARVWGNNLQPLHDLLLLLCLENRGNTASMHAVFGGFHLSVLVSEMQKTHLTVLNQ